MKLKLGYSLQRSIPYLKIFNKIVHEELDLLSIELVHIEHIDNTLLLEVLLINPTKHTYYWYANSLRSSLQEIPIDSQDYCILPEFEKVIQVQSELFQNNHISLELLSTFYLGGSSVVKKTVIESSLLSKAG